MRRLILLGDSRCRVLKALLLQATIAVPAIGKNVAAGFDLVGEELLQRLCGGIGNHFQSRKSWHRLLARLARAAMLHRNGHHGFGPHAACATPAPPLAMLRLARQCGINVAESRIESVGGKDVLVKRFDRERTANGYTRARMISGLTVLRSDEALETRTRWSYVILVEELRRIVAEPKKDAQELFRRMCFNALISNLDDHPRNHAFIAKDEEWSLSPAYDLTPSPVISQDRRDLAMECGDLGRFANARNIVSQYARFLLEKSEAEKIVNDTRNQVEKWYDTVRACGVSETDAETIHGAFLYPGFSL